TWTFHRHRGRGAPFVRQGRQGRQTRLSGRTHDGSTSADLLRFGGTETGFAADLDFAAVQVDGLKCADQSTRTRPHLTNGERERTKQAVDRRRVRCAEGPADRGD